MDWKIFLHQDKHVFWLRKKKSYCCPDQARPVLLSDDCKWCPSPPCRSPDLSLWEGRLFPVDIRVFWRQCWAKQWMGIPDTQARWKEIPMGGGAPGERGHWRTVRCHPLSSVHQCRRGANASCPSPDTIPFLGLEGPLWAESNLSVSLTLEYCLLSLMQTQNCCLCRNLQTSFLSLEERIASTRHSLSEATF